MIDQSQSRIYVSGEDGTQYWFDRTHDELGRGSTARVYKATSVAQPTKQIAVKSGLSNLQGEDLELFWEELSIIKALKETNYVPGAERGRLVKGDQNAPIILIELIPPDNLLVEKLRTSTDPNLALRAAVQYASLLQFMHQVDITSRGDRKLEDLRWHENRLIVLDWNRAVQERIGRIKRDVAPRLVQREYERQDLRLFGRLWAIIFGLNLVSDSVPTLGDEQWGELSHGWQHILRQSLLSEPSRGYQSAADLLIDLKQLLQYAQMSSGKLLLEAEKLARQVSASSTQSVKTAQDIQLGLGQLKRADLPIAEKRRFDGLTNWFKNTLAKAKHQSHESVSIVRSHLRLLQFDEAIEAIEDASARIGKQTEDARRIQVELQRLICVVEASRSGLLEYNLDVSPIIEDLLTILEDIAVSVVNEIDIQALTKSGERLEHLQDKLRMHEKSNNLIAEVEIWKAIDRDLSAESSSLIQSTDDILIQAWEYLKTNARAYADALSQAFPVLRSVIAKRETLPAINAWAVERFNALGAAFRRLRDAIILNDSFWTRSYGSLIQDAEIEYRKLSESYYGLDQTKMHAKPIGQLLSWLRDIHECKYGRYRASDMEMLKHLSLPNRDQHYNQDEQLVQHVFKLVLDEIMRKHDCAQHGWPDEQRFALALANEMVQAVDSAPDIVSHDIRNRVTTYHQHVLSWGGEIRRLQKICGLTTGSDYEKAHELIRTTAKQVRQAINEAAQTNIQLFERSPKLSDMNTVQTIQALQTLQRELDGLQITTAHISQQKREIDRAILNLKETENEASQYLDQYDKQDTAILFENIAEKDGQIRDWLDEFAEGRNLDLEIRLRELQTQIENIEKSRQRIPSLANLDTASLDTLQGSLAQLNAHFDALQTDSQDPQIMELLQKLEASYVDDRPEKLAQRQNWLDQLDQLQITRSRDMATYVGHRHKFAQYQAFFKAESRVTKQWDSLLTKASQLQLEDIRRPQHDTENLYYRWRALELPKAYIGRLANVVDQVQEHFRNANVSLAKLQKQKKDDQIDLLLWLEARADSLRAIVERP